MSDFTSYVAIRFAFLVHQYGMEMLEINLDAVIFKNNNLIININYDSKRSYEFSVSLYSNDGHKIEYFVGLYDILLYYNSADAERFKLVITTNHNVLNKFIDDSAYLVQTFLPRLLLNNNSDLNSLIAIKKAEIMNYNNLRRYRKPKLP